MKKQAYWQVGDIIGMIQNDNNKEEEMKTKPTEALKIIDENWDKGGTLNNLKIADIIACNVAFKEGQSNPKIKQLEWKENSNETRWHSDLPIGAYTICTFSKYEPYSLRFYLGEYDLPEYERSCKTIEEAMMYAQLDFEARIKECLITE